MTTLKKPLLALIFCIPLAACGSSWEDRALSGGGIGAGAPGVQVHREQARMIQIHRGHAGQHSSSFIGCCATRRTCWHSS